VARDATLIVRAPELTATDIIKRIVAKKADWILRRQKYARRTYVQPTAKEFVNGEGFLYLGETYRLHIVNSQDVPIRFDRAFYLSQSSIQRAHLVFLEWYWQQATEILTKRAEWFARKGGFHYNKVNITDAKKRWGSCSHKGNLNFSWRLVMAPVQVIDYVVAHELAHLRHKSHSEEFWKTVSIIVPTYRTAIDWLSQNGDTLSIVVTNE
jgi:hypothetical protein